MAIFCDSPPVEIKIADAPLNINNHKCMCCGLVTKF